MKVYMCRNCGQLIDFAGLPVDINTDKPDNCELGICKDCEDYEQTEYKIEREVLQIFFDEVDE